MVYHWISNFISPCSVCDALGCQSRVTCPPPYITCSSSASRYRPILSPTTDHVGMDMVTRTRMVVQVCILMMVCPVSERTIHWNCIVEMMLIVITITLPVIAKIPQMSTSLSMPVRKAPLSRLEHDTWTRTPPGISLAMSSSVTWRAQAAG